MTLKEKTYSAVRWTSASAVFRAALQIVQVAVLARLLSPEDYGLMAMVGVVLGFAGVFADLGLSSAFVQRKQVTEEERSSLFWLNVVVGAAFTFLVGVSSPVIAILYGDNRLTPLVALSALSFLVVSLGQQVRVAAEKELHFRSVVVLETGATFVGFLTALVSAACGLGVYSLVLGGLATSSLASAFAWLFLASGWRPQLRLQLKDVQPYLAFGVAVVGSNIVGQIHQTLDLLLGGRLLGAAQLGLYSLPRNLVLQIQFLINPVITRVGFPLIARVQNDADRVRSIYLKTLNMTASVNAFLYVYMAFFAPEIVRILLGGKWAGAVSLLRLLAVWGVARSVINPVGSLLLGMGRASLAFGWNAALLVVVPPVLWVGAAHGSIGLARALVGLSFFLLVPSWYFLVRPLCGATLAEYSLQVVRPMAIAVLSVFSAYSLVCHINASMLRLTIGLSLSVMCYFAMGCLLNKEWIRAMCGLFARSRGF